MTHEFSNYKRSLRLELPRNPRSGSGAAFLWGARQTGKTTYLHQRFPAARFYDLLGSDLAAELSLRPALFREQILADAPQLVIVDEIQIVPGLLPEIHWLLENSATQLILCGSSPRKLRRGAHNLLGGRAVDFQLHPLCTDEVAELDLLRLLRYGALPAHYLVEEPRPLLRAYINNYIKQEIIDESATRNVPAFSRFLQVVGHSHGQQINYSNVARESGVSASTVRSYYEILEETLLGFTLEPWRRRRKRRLVETAKFYLFDVGVANQLHPESPEVHEGSDRFGRAFEHFILNELRIRIAYQQRESSLTFWRTSSGFEVDFIVGDMELAIECKSTRELRAADLKGLRALREEETSRRSIVVCREERARRTDDGIEILPWRSFCRMWWGGELD